MADDQGKYATLIGREMWAFIAATNACYPEDTASRPITEQRRIYNAMCQQFRVAYPAGVVADDQIIATGTHNIAIRRYQLQNSSPGAHVLYFHGGGFVVGDLESHDDVCAEICAHTGMAVTSVDYRLAPEHVYPAAFDDALHSFNWLAQQATLPIILAGDSAGANLAAAVAHACRGRPVEAHGQLLIYPALASRFTGGSYEEHANAPMLSTADMNAYVEMLMGGAKMPADDPRLAPLADQDFSGLPKTRLFTAQCDPLAGDGPAYCEKIIAAGGDALCIEEAGLVHGYLRARHYAGAARAGFERILAGFAALA